MVDKLKVVEIDISKITMYENNAKLHPDSQIEQIANSIKQFGFNDPIALDEGNIIIEGHGRYLAAQKLGMSKIPCIILSHLTPAKKKAYIIAHNKLTTATGYDEERLLAEIEAIKLDEDFDFELNSVGIETINEKQIKKHIENNESFEDRANYYDDNNCKMPIVPEFFEKHECFLIPVHNSIDESFIRDVFNLNENYISNSGDKKFRKTNVISLEKIRCLVK